MEHLVPPLGPVPSGRADGAPSVSSTDQVFAGFESLTVRQRKKWAEILLSFELTNQYDVFQGTRRALHVQEQGSGFMGLIGRLFLGPLRPFQVDVTDDSETRVLLHLKRPFRFFFHRLEVRDSLGATVGAVQKKWSWIRRTYEIEDAHGRVILRVFGPILKPWTFQLLQDGAEVGAIRKRWSGFGKELFTDADNFGVDLRGISDARTKALAFAATVLIDVVHFERSKG